MNRVYFPSWSLAIVAWLMLGSTSALAEQMKRFGDYEIHYNAFGSGFLTPEVASTYGIVRSRTQGVLNITTLKVNPDGSRTAVDARVLTKVNNLIQQEWFLDFRTIDEGEAIYNIATFRFSDDDPLTFKVTVQPAGESTPFEFDFQQTFYVDR